MPILPGKNVKEKISLYRYVMSTVCQFQAPLSDKYFPLNGKGGNWNSDITPC